MPAKVMEHTQHLRNNALVSIKVSVKDTASVSSLQHILHTLHLRVFYSFQNHFEVPYSNRAEFCPARSKDYLISSSSRQKLNLKPRAENWI